MKTIVAAAVSSALAIGSLGYIAGAQSAAGAPADPFAPTALEAAQSPNVTRADLVARPAVRPVPVRPISYEPAPQVASRPAVREVEPVKEKRSWKKTALVIGAGAGSGAAIGAITSGKKGAGIGAAIGGGAASVYEVLKRR